MPNINKNIIKQAGAAVANATNKAAGLSASTPEPGTIISAIQLVNGGRTIGPAALAHFAESVRNKLLSLLVTMEPIQDFNGYSHPWPAGGGVNKFKISDAAGVTVASATYGLSIDLDAENETIRIHGVPTWSGDSSYTFRAIATKNGYWGHASVDHDYSGYKAYTKVLSKTSNVSSAGYFYVLDTSVISIAQITVTDANAIDITYRLSLNPDATPTSWTPYSNICPISGRTGLDVYAGPTSAIGDATNYSMDWTTPAGTVYAGSADIVTGDIKAAPYYASYNGETLAGPWVSSMDAYDPEGTPTTGAQVVDLGGTMTEYHITGQDIVTLVGDNYIWSDSGDVTITE